MLDIIVIGWVGYLLFTDFCFFVQRARDGGTSDDSSWSSARSDLTPPMTGVGVRGFPRLRSSERPAARVGRAISGGGSSSDSSSSGEDNAPLLPPGGGGGLVGLVVGGPPVDNVADAGEGAGVGAGDDEVDGVDLGLPAVGDGGADVVGGGGAGDGGIAGLVDHGSVVGGGDGIGGVGAGGVVDGVVGGDGGEGGGGGVDAGSNASSVDGNGDGIVVVGGGDGGVVVGGGGGDGVGLGVMIVHVDGGGVGLGHGTGRRWSTAQRAKYHKTCQDKSAKNVVKLRGQLRAANKKVDVLTTILAMNGLDAKGNPLGGGG